MNYYLRLGVLALMCLSVFVPVTAREHRLTTFAPAIYSSTSVVASEDGLLDADVFDEAGNLIDTIEGLPVRAGVPFVLAPDAAASALLRIRTSPSMTLSFNGEGTLTFDETATLLRFHMTDTRYALPLRLHVFNPSEETASLALRFRDTNGNDRTITQNSLLPHESRTIALRPLMIGHEQPAVIDVETSVPLGALLLRGREIIRALTDIEDRPDDDGTLYAAHARRSVVTNATVPEATTGFGNPLPYSFSNNGGNTWLAHDPSTYRYPVFHPGEDWNVPNTPGGSCNGDQGLSVVAAANGLVVWANSADWGGVVLRHLYLGQTWYTQYGHVQKISVRVGDTVVKGQTIAQIGKVGTTCAHLHFEIREGDHPNPTYGPYWTASLGTKSNVENWYEAPRAFIDSHPAYGIQVFDFWRRSDPLYSSPTAGPRAPNFDAQYKVRNPSTNGIVVEQLALAVHDSNGNFLYDMVDRYGYTRSYRNVYIGARQVFWFDISYGWLTTPGRYKVVAKAKTGGAWRNLASVDFTVVAPPPPPTPWWVSATDGNYRDRVAISWPAVAGAQYYQVFRSGNGNTGYIATVYSPGANDYYASPGFAYFYSVRACNSRGCSALSAADRGFRAK